MLASFQLMSALTVDASNAHVSTMPAAGGSSPHLVKYVLQKGPNNTYHAKPALPSSPLVTIKQEALPTINAATISATGAVIPGPVHHSGGNPSLQQHQPRQNQPPAIFLQASPANSGNSHRSVTVNTSSSRMPTAATAISPGGSVYLVKTNHETSRPMLTLVSRGSSSSSSNANNNQAAIGIMNPSVASGTNYHSYQQQQNLKLGQLVVNRAAAGAAAAVHISQQSQSHNPSIIHQQVSASGATVSNAAPTASAFHFPILPQPNMTAKSQTSLSSKHHNNNTQPAQYYLNTSNGSRSIDFGGALQTSSSAHNGFNSNVDVTSQLGGAGMGRRQAVSVSTYKKVMVLPSYLAEAECRNNNLSLSSALPPSSLSTSSNLVDPQYRTTDNTTGAFVTAQSGAGATTSHLINSANGLPLMPAPQSHLSHGSLSMMSQSDYHSAVGGAPYQGSVDGPGASVEPANQGAVFNAYISLRNVVASFQVKCYLTLRTIALNAHNVEYKRESGRVMMKLRKPEVTANIWSSGRITCTGAKSAEEAKVACRRVARVLQKLDFNVKFCKFKVNNVLATTSFPFGVKLHELGEKGENVQYEPELHPAALVRFPNLHGNAIAKIFATGSVTLTANSVQAIQDAVVLLYPVLEPFKTAKPLPSQTTSSTRKRPGRSGGNRSRKTTKNSKCTGAGMEDYDFDSDDSQCSEEL